MIVVAVILFGREMILKLKPEFKKKEKEERKEGKEKLL